MNLRTLRKRRGWTQQDLEDRCGITQSMISRLERPTAAAANPKLSIARVLGKAFGVDPMTIEFGPIKRRPPKRRRRARRPAPVPAAAITAPAGELEAEV